MEDGAAVFVCSNIFLAFVVHPGGFGTPAKPCLSLRVTCL